MKGVRFYLEHGSKQDKRKKVHRGNVVAAYVDMQPFLLNGGPHWEAVAALYDVPDSVVCNMAVSWEFLRTKCKRISEKEAREIHPKLFLYLEDDDVPQAP